MKFYSKIILCFFLLSLTSCNNDDDNARPSTSVNDFVWRGLNSWYYWKDDVPYLDSEYENSSFVNDATSPEDLFYSLLYEYGEVDRFSWIVDDYASLIAQFSGVEKSFGFEYGLYYKDQSRDKIIGYIEYVVPNSPASNANLSRGDVFSSINGQELDVNNYINLLTQNSYNLGLVTVTEVNDSEIMTTGIEREVALTRTEIEENPIHFMSIIEDGTNRIGYLVYNGFRANYNDELNTAIGQLASEGITDLILDLRYNRGGSLNTAVGLGSMITGQFTGENFVSTRFNEKHTDYNSTEKFVQNLKTYEFVNGSNQETGEISINHLGLNEIYVFTSGSTASASELLINSLRPYINVITVGGKTYGKFVGSVTLVDSPSNDFLSSSNRNPNHNYAMQPIVFSYFNSENGNNNNIGIDPNIELSERNSLAGHYAFGDINDPYITAVINHINARYSPSVPLSDSHKELISKELRKTKKSLLYLDEPIVLKE